jgi:2-oxo-4-hydroxy-4-carboxy-5-ureidoimidazoline decarboxylase
VRGVAALDAMPGQEAERSLLSACGSREWARRMTAARPFGTLDALLAMAGGVWAALPEESWREALAAHPRIGERSVSGREAREQAGALSAGEDALEALARANAEYEARFGWIFVVFASGKSAAEMLALCRARLHNDPATEIRVAAEEQAKITRLRLERLADDPPTRE